MGCVLRIFCIYMALLYERKYLIAVGAAPFLALAIPEIRDRILDLTHGNEVVTYGDFKLLCVAKVYLGVRAKLDATQ